MNVTCNPVGKLSPEKLREKSDSYRIACEALMIASDSGCSGETYERLTEMVLREARKADA